MTRLPWYYMTLVSVWIFAQSLWNAMHSTVETWYNNILGTRNFVCYIKYFVISVVNKQYNTKESNSLGPEKLLCYIRYFVISDLFILSFHCIVLLSDMTCVSPLVLPWSHCERIHIIVQSYNTMLYKFVWHCINMNFAQKRFVRQPFTFCSIRRLNESAQLVLKLDSAHFIHVIWMSDRWPPCILSRWSC